MILSNLESQIDPIVDGPNKESKGPTYRQILISILANGKAVDSHEARTAASAIIKLRAIPFSDVQLSDEEAALLRKRAEGNTSAFMTWIHGQLLLYLDNF